METKKNKNLLYRVQALTLAVAMLLSLMPATVMQVSAETTGKWSSDYTTDALTGTGTQEDPYQLSSAQDLAKLAQDASLAKGNKAFVITKDIDLSAHEWVPIAEFKGSLDGGGHCITGLNIGTAAEPAKLVNAGFIATLSAGGVKNLSVQVEIYTMGMNGTAASDSHVGGLVGNLTGTLDNCAVHGYITAGSTSKNLYVGGLAGRVNGASSISNCANYADVSADSGAATGTHNTAAGGIIGCEYSNNTASVINCANYGEAVVVQGVKARSFEGGIVGRGMVATSPVTNCYNGESVANTSNPNISYQGEVAAFGCTVTNCYYKNSNGVNCTVSDNSEVPDILATLNTNASGMEGANTWSADAEGNPVPLNNLGLPALTPELKVEGSVKFGERLTAVTANAGDGTLRYQWYYAPAVEGDADIAIDGATGSEYTIQAADVGKTIICSVSGGNIDGSLREVVGVVAKAEGPAAPAVDSVNASSQSASDGKITGTTAAMEYSNSTAFVDARDCSANETAGLQPGIYYVRIKATDTHEAGASAEIVVGPYVEKWTAEGNYTAGALSGSGTQADPFLITSAADLAKMAVSYNSVSATANKYFKITAKTIDLSNHEWVPIKNFVGVFDGNGAVITGLKIGTETAPASYIEAGLFGNIGSGSVVKNLQVDAAIYVRYYDVAFMTVGGIAGFCNGSIDSCGVTGTVWAEAAAPAGIKNDVFVGGIAGRVRPLKSTDTVVISNCTSQASVYAIRNQADRFVKAGGIVGYMHSTIEKTAILVNCANFGDVYAQGTSPNEGAGGIAGFFGNESFAGDSTFTIHNCYSTGKVEANAAGNVLAGMGNAAAGGLYYMEEAGNQANAIDTGNAEMLTQAVVASNDFVNILDINACSVNEKLPSVIAKKWTLDNYPVPTGELATDKALIIKLNSKRYGGVKVEAQSTDESTFSEKALNCLLENGSTVKLTLTPTTGCELDNISVDGVDVTASVVDNVYTFVISKSSEVQVNFKAGTPTEAAPIYVNPNAAGGDGTTPETALRTLEEAKAALNTLISSQINCNVTVYLMGGQYELDDALVLTEAQSSLGRITFKAYNGEKAVITGAKDITGTFTQVSGKNYWSYQLPESSKQGGDYPEFRDLIVNGERANIARTKDYVFTKSYRNQVITSGKVSSCDNLLYVDPDSLSGISNSNLNGVEIVSLVEWKSQLFHIADIAFSGNYAEIVLDADEWSKFQYDTTKKSLEGRVYWMQNHLNFLDEPGEFWYDHAQGVIYYYPYSDQNMATATVEYSLLDKLIDIQGGANFTFDGIEFTGTTANFINEHGLVAQLGATHAMYTNDPGTNVPCAAIWAEGAEGLQILNCNFHELGGTAFLSNYGTKDLEIRGNVIRNVGIGGVIVGVNQRQWNESGLLGASENVSITNNYITNVGTIVPCAPAIKVARSENLTINHNTIVHVSYSAIMAGWGWNVQGTEAHNTNLTNAEIAYNYVEDFLYGINDGGAIYTCGANGFTTETDYFNTVHDNYIRAGAHNKTYVGIYHDGSSSNWHTYQNVIDDLKSSHGPIFFQDAVSSQYSHNILAENNYTSVSEISTSAKDDRNIVLRGNVMVADRSQFCAQAQQIIANAGLEAEYKAIADPMDTQLRIADNSMRYTYTQNQGIATQGQVEITNNSNIAKSFTLSLTNPLPSNYTCTFANNGLTLNPGESGIITMNFTAKDEDNVVDSADSIMGFLVTDSTGRTVKYPRAFTFASKQDAGDFELPDGSKKIAYGKPTIDGVMDEAYKNSYRMAFGNVTWPNDFAESDVAGYVYLLWDEQYLYVYAYVEDSTVMSRGAAVMDTCDVNEIWKNDVLETYIETTLTGTQRMTKFAVDAFGYKRFGQAFPEGNHDAYHNALPYATAFLNNGQIIPDFQITDPTAGQAASTDAQKVTGYVIEMTLPLTEDIHITDKTPKAGDQIVFHAQNNDLQYMDGTTPYVVAKANANTTFTLVKAEADEFEIIGSAIDAKVATVTAPEGGWIEGENNTFVVSADVACVVAVSNDGGKTYTRLAATAVEGGYSFTADLTADSQIAVVVAGDANGDGKITNADAGLIKAVALERETADALMLLTMDVNNSGTITNADAGLLTAVALGLETLTW